MFDMLNFCNVELAEIDCKRPSCDGYSVTNLISTNSDRKKGFLVDYFVKPPVDILLKFPCDVNVRRINLNCAVGSQKSKLIHILTKTTRNLQCIVAKGTVDRNEKHLVFYLRGTQEDKSGKHETFYNTKNLNNVKHLIIRILQTEGSSVPALGALEVWGYVSSNVPKSIMNSVLEMWKKIQLPKKNSENIISDIQVYDGRIENVLEPFKVPEEFLDPITCDIFTIPMMMPSGKVVDIITLEKFYKAEENWGRGPSDPFTGVLFTNGSKPVVATSLKERLDKFLMDNCNIPVLKNIPRTIGRDMKQNTHQLPGNSCCSFSSSFSYDVATISKRKLKDIDSLLEQSLSGLPTFLEKPVVKKQKIECMKCSKCEIHFRLLCEHFICRICLVAMNRSEDNRCICNKKINFNEIMRYHMNT